VACGGVCCGALRVSVRIDKEKAKKQTISHTRKNKKS